MRVTSAVVASVFIGLAGTPVPVRTAQGATIAALAGAGADLSMGRDTGLPERGAELSAMGPRFLPAPCRSAGVAEICLAHGDRRPAVPGPGPLAPDRGQAAAVSAGLLALFWCAVFPRRGRRAQRVVSVIRRST